MKAWPVIWLLPILTGCNTSDESAKNAARDAYAACTMAAVKRLDDGRSDPASIAMGVAGACSGQYGQLSLSMQDEMTTENGQAFMRDKMQTNELRFATAAVLTYRASKRAQQ